MQTGVEAKDAGRRGFTTKARRDEENQKAINHGGAESTEEMLSLGKDWEGWPQMAQMSQIKKNGECQEDTVEPQPKRIHHEGAESTEGWRKARKDEGTKARRDGGTEARRDGAM